MPTTNTEARKILAILREHMSEEDAIDILDRLWREVGQSTDNESLKESLKMLRNMVILPSNR